MPRELKIPAHEVFDGLKVEGDGTDLRPNETPDTKNDDISTPEELKIRTGVEKQNATSLGAYPITNIGYIRVDNMVYKQVKINGALESI
jgi:hypothetical protein